MKCQAQLAFISVLLPFVGAYYVDELDIDTDEIDHFVNTFKQNLWQGNQAQMESAGRRLVAGATGAVPDVSYASVCTGTCWNSVQTQFATAVQTMDGSVCKAKEKSKKVAKVQATKTKNDAKKKQKKKNEDAKGAAKGDAKGAAGGDKVAGGDKPKSGEGNKSAASGGDKKGASGDKAAGGKRMLGAKKVKEAVGKASADCIFDLCATTQIAAMCSNSSGIMDNYIMDECQASNALFLCDSICSSHCSPGGTPDVNMKKLLCGSTGKSQGGKFDNEKGGGDLKNMFNMMCMKNGADYCYDTIKGDIAGNNFAQGKDDTKFPDQCNLTCNSTMASTIKALGCCFPAVLDIQRKYKVMKGGAARNAKAVAAKCADDTAFSTCSTGRLTTTKSKRFSLNLSIACDSMSNETSEAEFATTMADMLNLTDGDVELIACKAKGSKCAGARRLATTSGSEVDVNLQTSGADAEAQLTALTASMADAAFLADLTENAALSAEDVTDTTGNTTGTTGTTGSTDGTGLVSGSQRGYAFGVLSLLLAIGAHSP